MNEVNTGNVNGIVHVSTPTIDVAAALKQLDKNARLFVDTGNGFKRIGAADAFRNLSAETPVIIVNAASHVERSSAQANAGAGDHSTFWGQTLSWSVGSGSQRARSTSVAFTTESVRTLAELAFVDLSIPGVPGAPVLPKNGGPVAISQEFELSWQSRSAAVKPERLGTQRHSQYDESRFERGSTRAIR